MKNPIVEVTSEDSLCFQDDVNGVVVKMREQLANHLSLNLDIHELFLLSLTKIGDLQFSDELPEGMSSDPANALINRLRRCIRKRTALRFTDEEFFIFSLTEYGEYLGLQLEDDEDEEGDEDDLEPNHSLPPASDQVECNTLVTNGSKTDKSNCQNKESNSGKDANIKPK